ALAAVNNNRRRVSGRAAAVGKELSIFMSSMPGRLRPAQRRVAMSIGFAKNMPRTRAGRAGQTSICRRQLDKLGRRKLRFGAIFPAFRPFFYALAPPQPGRCPAVEARFRGISRSIVKSHKTAALALFLLSQTSNACLKDRPVADHPAC